MYNNNIHVSFFYHIAVNKIYLVGPKSNERSSM